jgi:hypothetical protein
LIPRVGRPNDARARETLRVLALEAGFDRVFDASDAYAGANPADLAIEPDDFHPNAKGHARLANRIDELLGGLTGLRRIISEGASAERANPDTQNTTLSAARTHEPSALKKGQHE